MALVRKLENVMHLRSVNRIAVCVYFLLCGYFCVSNAFGQNPIASLKDIYKKDFTIGTALNSSQINELNAAETQFIVSQFNAITPENVMKSVIIHPEWNRYDFTLADKIVDYGKKYHIGVNGHTLIWHSQLPQFMRHINDADSVRSFFTNHIKTVAARYDGKVYSWDVVNEALEEDGSLRKSIFLEKLGENYIVEAFRLAQKASPKSLLYYNDYNIESPKKRAGALALVKKIKAAGVRIDGVGIQGHWHAGNVPLKEIEESIIAFAALGVKVMLTELDLSVLPNPSAVEGADVSQNATYQETLNPFKNGLPDSVQEQLAKDYEALFRVFSKHKNKISRVTFWGVSDGQSWLNNWPVRGRTNYPLLFDKNNQPKPAFYKVTGLK
jgi:endo-1,4-beta-xylanase